LPKAALWVAESGTLSLAMRFLGRHKRAEAP